MWWVPVGWGPGVNNEATNILGGVDVSLTECGYSRGCALSNKFYKGGSEVV